MTKDFTSAFFSVPENQGKTAPVPQPSTAGPAFRHRSEVTAAMKDARYGKDPAYRAEVERMISRSNLFGS